MNKQSWLLNHQPVENAPGVSRSIPRSFYLNCVSGFARRRGAGADPDDDAFYLAGGGFR